MAEASRHDAWQAGDAYDAYMGRWSRQIAPRFLDWLEMPPRLDWLEVGCGTGALSAAILAKCDPQSLLAIDASASFIATAQTAMTDGRVEFRVGDAQALDVADASRDVIVSALALNFVPDRQKALTEMKRVGRPGATVGFYVWDYPGGGQEFIRAFWEVATSLDPAAKDLTESGRFPYCTPAGLTELMSGAGLSVIGCTAIERPTVFRDFDDYWGPFIRGVGPAPGYCVSLDGEAQERLKTKLAESLPRQADGAIAMRVRAWAVKGIVP